MIHQLQTLDEAIGKVIEDLGLGYDAPIMPRFIAKCVTDAMKHVGCYYQYVSKVKVVEINNYKGTLPCDLESIEDAENACIYNPEITNPRELPYETIDTPEWKVEQNTIITKFREGTITIKYRAFPTDKKGFILVPDNISFNEAFKWRTAYGLSIQGYTFKNPQLNDIRFSEIRWHHYCRQSRAEGNRQGSLILNRIANNINTLLPDRAAHLSDFYNSGKKEILTLDGNN